MDKLKDLVIDGANVNEISFALHHGLTLGDARNMFKNTFEKNINLLFNSKQQVETETINKILPSLKNAENSSLRTQEHFLALAEHELKYKQEEVNIKRDVVATERLMLELLWKVFHLKRNSHDEDKTTITFIGTKEEVKEIISKYPLKLDKQ